MQPFILTEPSVRIRFAVLTGLCGQRGIMFYFKFNRMASFNSVFHSTLSFAGLCPDTPSGTLSLNPAKGEYIPFGIPLLVIHGGILWQNILKPEFFSSKNHQK